MSIIDCSPGSMRYDKRIRSLYVNMWTYVCKAILASRDIYYSCIDLRIIFLVALDKHNNVSEQSPKEDNRILELYKYFYA